MAWAPIYQPEGPRFHVCNDHMKKATKEWGCTMTPYNDGQAFLGPSLKDSNWTEKDK